MKNIVLARPSSLIITDMKRLIAELNLEAKSLANLKELESFDPKTIGAIVISSAISSPVKHHYCDVIEKAKKLYPGIPLFLSSFTSVYSTRVIANAHFKKADIDMEPVSLEEIKTNGFDPYRQILILTQKELANPNLLQAIAIQVYEVINANYREAG